VRAFPPTPRVMCFSLKGISLYLNTVEQTINVVSWLIVFLTGTCLQDFKLLAN
jgi:hypothetical protein